MYTFLVSVTLKIDWTIHVRWLTLVQSEISVWWTRHFLKARALDCDKSDFD